MKVKNIRQIDLANKIGCDKSLINRILHGIEEPTQRIKIKIGEVLKVDSAVLFG